MGKITTLRRIAQITSFFLIFYISVLSLRQIDTKFIPFVEPPEGLERPKWYDPPAGYVEIVDTYMPVKTCRFIAGESRIFRACFLHFAVESILWLTPLKMVLFHVVLFIVLCFIFGRFMCGWICPLGFLSEMLSWIREKVGIPKIKLSDSIINFLSKFKYFLVATIFLVTIAVAIPFLSSLILGSGTCKTELSILSCAICPARVLFPLLGGHAAGGFSFETAIYAVLSAVGIVFLLFYMFGAFSPRAWCKICPSGTLMSFFNKGSLMTKEKDVLKCNKCGTCKRVCDMQIKDVYEEKTKKNIDTENCIRCFSCVDHCPESDCLTVKIFGKTLFRSGSSFKAKIKAKEKTKDKTKHRQKIIKRGDKILKRRRER